MPIEIVKKAPSTETRETLHHFFDSFIEFIKTSVNTQSQFYPFFEANHKKYGRGLHCIFFDVPIPLEEKNYISFYHTCSLRFFPEQKGTDLIWTAEDFLSDFIEFEHPVVPSEMDILLENLQGSLNTYNLAKDIVIWVECTPFNALTKVRDEDFTVSGCYLGKFLDCVLAEYQLS